MAQGEPLPGEYPPPRHMLRDLRLETWRDAEGPHTRIPVCSEICGAGGVRLGVLATLADVAGGAAALEAVNPDWIATSDLMVHRLGGPGRGALEATARVSRAGRRSVLLEVDVRDDEGPIALATMGFTRLAARGGVQQHGSRPEERFDFALPDSGLSCPFVDAIGAISRDPAGVELAVTPYVGNSLGALQGGAAATLLDRAAELAGGEALGAAVAVSDMAVHFVALGRVGPMRAQASLLRRREKSALFRVAMVDAGAGGRLGALATAWVERAPA